MSDAREPKVVSAQMSKLEPKPPTPYVGQTSQLPPAWNTVPGHVAPERTFGRGTDADCYEMLGHAPHGRCATWRDAQLEAEAMLADALWAHVCELARSGQLTTRKQRRNMARSARRRARGDAR